jgi:hypothetical protein
MVTTQMIVTMLIGVVAPIIVSLVTKASMSGQIKGTLLALISAVTGIGQGFLAAPPDQVWNWQFAVFSAITSFIVGVGTYFGLLAPENKNGVAPATVLQGKFIKDPPVDDTYIADAA